MYYSYHCPYTVVISFVLWTHVTHPLSFLCSSVPHALQISRKSGSTEHATELQQTWTDKYMDAKRTRSRIKRMSSIYNQLGPFLFDVRSNILCMLKTCHRIDPTSPDEERISPHVTRRQAYKQRMRTDTKRMENRRLRFSSVWCYPARCDTPG